MTVYIYACTPWVEQLANPEAHVQQICDCVRYCQAEGLPITPGECAFEDGASSNYQLRISAGPHSLGAFSNAPHSGSSWKRQPLVMCWSSDHCIDLRAACGRSSLECGRFWCPDSSQCVSRIASLI